MPRILFGLFLALHRLVHLLFFGQSAQLLNLQPGLTWPIDSWALSGLFAERRRRWVAGALCILLAMGFVFGAVGVARIRSWADPVVVTSSGISILLFILFWDGHLRRLDQQGAVLLDLAIVGAARFLF
jgi:hypothetical protein